MIKFAKAITIIFSLLYVVGVIAPLWIKMPWWVLLIYVLGVSGLFIGITLGASSYVRKHNKSVFWFQYLDSFYPKKFDNEQYINAIDMINTIYDEKSPLLDEKIVKKKDLLERKKNLNTDIEFGKLTPVKLITVVASAILSYFLQILQSAISPAFDADGFLAKLKDLIVSNTDIDAILKSVKEILPTSTAQDNWNFTACIITVFVLVSVEIIIIKAPDLRSECLEYEIKKIESVLQKDKSKKSYDNMYVESAYMYLENVSNNKKDKIKTDTNTTKNIKDFLSDYNALDKNTQDKLNSVMTDSKLYGQIFKK